MAMSGDVTTTNTPAIPHSPASNYTPGFVAVIRAFYYVILWNVDTFNAIFYKGHLSVERYDNRSWLAMY